MVRMRRSVITGIGWALALVAVAAVAAVAGTAGQLLSFPEEFEFGVATSAYQVEGAWDQDGKAESIWDRMVHSRPWAVEDGSSGDVACDSFRRWRRDVRAAAALGVRAYRFSLSWPRLVPDALRPAASAASRSAAALHYRAMAAELRARGMRPLVTLYHWDLPQQLQDLGGWANPLTVDAFEAFARVAAAALADLVDAWVSVNEPKQVCLGGYGRDAYAPQLNGSATGAQYLCAKHVLLAHARACRVIRAARPDARCGIALHTQLYRPESNSSEDRAAAESAEAFEQGLYLHPLFDPSGSGDFPQLVKERVAQRSAEQGFRRSRLPTLSGEERALLRGSADFLGANSYRSFLVRSSPSSSASLSLSLSPSHEDDTGAELVHWPEHYQPDEYWAYAEMLKRLSALYGRPPLVVLESGLGLTPAQEAQEAAEAGARGEHVRRCLRAVARARAAGADVRGYTVWSLMDNFEWRHGFALRFGLFRVEGPPRRLTLQPKRSAALFRRIVAERAVHPDPAYYEDTDLRFPDVNDYY